MKGAEKRRISPGVLANQYEADAGKLREKLERGVGTSEERALWTRSAESLMKQADDLRLGATEKGSP